MFSPDAACKVIEEERHSHVFYQAEPDIWMVMDSLLALNKLREEVDLEKARGNREKPDHEKNFEMCIRAKSNTWIIAKITLGRELYMVLEKANEMLWKSSATDAS